ncbi:hypothetical protein MPSEU_000797600 [Mayamaea pseudoterrestris]|nr:hypothetical protein MPSEU_000797600 [Mayamaea pseudoterrestris]
MRPKPTREWVMAELERLGVRVVSGRLGRKGGEDDDESESEGRKKGPTKGVNISAASMPMERTSSIGWGGADADLNSLMMARRNSSLGLSIMNDTGRGSLALGHVMLDTGDPTMPPHRPLVGGGAAAAYEAARHDHFTQKASEQQRRGSSLGLGSLGGGNGGIGNVGLSVSANQHYEMLKLHHMNLLNEIQETTLMMNLYQQQQLQQQHQQLQAQANVEMGNDPTGLALMMQSGAAGLDMFAGQLSQRGSLGLGAPMGSGFGNAQLQLIQQQQMQQALLQQQAARATENPPAPAAGPLANELEGRIAQLKQDIAKSDDDTMSEKKRSPEDTAEEEEESQQLPPTKRAKKVDTDQAEKLSGDKSKGSAAV